MSQLIGTFHPDHLNAEVEATESVTIVSGAGVLVRGTVLGKITASGKCTIVNTAGTDDGRRTPYAILAEDVDATSADKVAPAYLAATGVDPLALVFGGTDTITTHKVALRDLGIFVQNAQPAVNG